MAVRADVSTCVSRWVWGDRFRAGRGAFPTGAACLAGQDEALSLESNTIKSPQVSTEASVRGRSQKRSPAGPLAPMPAGEQSGLRCTSQAGVRTDGQF